MFIDILNEDIKKKDIITIDSFVSNVDKIGNLDDALDLLNDEHLQFYSDNERQINKVLRKRNLLEDWGSPEGPGYTGWARSPEKKIKTIKYKGEIISLEWDPELATWMPVIRFRSVTQALKFGKTLAEMARNS
jgi:hypothetical protein